MPNDLSNDYKKSVALLRGDQTYIDYENVTEDDFDGVEVFEKLAKIGEAQGELAEFQELNKLAAKGMKYGINNVKTQYKLYKKDIRKIELASREQQTQFTDQPATLKTTWAATDSGIYKNEEIACKHPIMITQNYINIDTNTIKVEIAFKRFKRWQTIIVDKVDISSRPNIIMLSSFGISVTSENAGALIVYLQELQDINDLPLVYSTARLGWVQDHFMPYTENLIFDGEVEFQRLFKSVEQKGDRDAWYSLVGKLRSENPIYSLILAASLVSPILEKISALPTFIHLWSGIAASGKTVLAMIAASCWGDPRPGHFMQSFNSTNVAMERLAATLNSLPLILDELQLSKDNWGNQRFDVYKLAQGLGKGRGRRTGGIEQVSTWCNTIITTGESPIVSRSDGQGAHARVVEVELKNVLIPLNKGNTIVQEISNNHGWAGLDLIRAIKNMDLSERYRELIKDLQEAKTDIQEKQLMIGAAILLADEIITEQLFLDDTNPNRLTINYLMEFLKTRGESSIEKRALDLTLDWVAVNKNKFDEMTMHDCYGFIENETVYIIRSVFNKLMADNGFSDRSVLSLWAQKNMIEVYTEPNSGKTRHTVRKSIDGNQVSVVALLSRHDEQDKQEAIAELVRYAQE